MQELTNLTQKLLNKIILAVDKTDGAKATKVGITPSRFSWYHQAETSERLIAHKELEAIAMNSQVISFDYINQGFDAIPVLRSITVNDGDKFLKKLNITPKSEWLLKCILQLKILLNTAPIWLSKALNRLPSEWQKGINSSGFSPKQLSKLELAIKMAIWIDTHSPELCDFRTASVQALGDSKLLEQNINWIAKVLKLKDPEKLSELTDLEVVEAFGLSRFEPEIKFRGNSCISYSNGVMSTRFATPYISLPTTDIQSITCDINPSYIILIENLTTFKRYCSEVNDGSLVVYTSGFPCNRWVKLMKSLLEILPSSISIFHWGDIDIGGYRILSFLTSALGKDIIPYQMIDDRSPKSNKVIEINDLRSALGDNLSGNLLTLDRRLEALSLRSKTLTVTEQESLSVKAPKLTKAIITKN